MALVGLLYPPIEIGGFKMIDVLIAQLGINPPLQGGPSVFSTIFNQLSNEKRAFITHFNLFFKFK
jgi:hypothetical protein